MDSTDLIDRYPEIERKIRANGSIESIERCLKPIRDNVEYIIETINEICSLKELEIENAFAFQSRAMGTCKPTSDIDIYVQLHWQHTYLVETNGVLYKNTGIKIICGEWADKFLSDIPEKIMDGLHKKRIDLFFGVEKHPPAKDEYKNSNYYVNLEKLRQKK